MNFELDSELLKTYTKLNEYYDEDQAYDSWRDDQLLSEIAEYESHTTPEERFRDFFWGRALYANYIGAGDKALNEKAFHDGYDSILTKLGFSADLWTTDGKFKDKETSKALLNTLNSTDKLETDAIDAAKELWKRQFERGLKSSTETEAEAKARREAEAAKRAAEKKAHDDKRAQNRQNAKIAGLSEQAQEFLVTEANMIYVDALASLEAQFELAPGDNLKTAEILRKIAKFTYADDLPDNDSDGYYRWNDDAYLVDARYEANGQDSLKLILTLAIDGVYVEQGAYHDDNYYEEPYYDEHESDCSASAELEITIKTADTSTDAWDYPDDCSFEAD